MSLHDPADPFPVSLGDTLGGTAVGDDLYVAIGQQYIDEHAVAKFGVPDVQVREGLDGTFPRREPGPDLPRFQGSLDDEADLAAGTGKLTRLLAPTEASLIAVEPVAGMRETTFFSLNGPPSNVP